MPWPQKTDATHYHAQLGLPDKSRAIKGLIANVCCSMAKINDLWDGAMDQRNVRGLVPCCCCQDGYRAQVPQHTKNTYRYISLFFYRR